ncbi:hypothetical protein NXF25_021362 [Crotalus adamanteus]|uniref:Ig-like domain-containing protein n=1 Tax=Crotalus adamanteus TaxID=8729 RepID=A0AAW1B8L4_CROAD
MFSRTWKTQWRTLLIGLFILFCRLEAQVSQTPENLEVQEGNPFTLKCNYSSQYRPYFWYHQLPGAQPSLILSVDSVGSTSKKPFVAEYLENGKESHLRSSRSQLQDSGNYLCAVETQ